MLVITEHLKLLESKAQERGLNSRELARRAGLHPNTLRKFRGAGNKRRRNIEWHPTITTIMAIEPVLLTPKERKVAAGAIVQLQPAP